MSDPWSVKERKARMHRRVWRTAQGELIPYSDLTDEHLAGIIDHLLARAYRRWTMTGVYSLCAYSPGGEAAADACESAMIGLIERLDKLDELESKIFEGEGFEDGDGPWREHANPELALLEAERERRARRRH